MNSTTINTAHINSARINSVRVSGTGSPSPQKKIAPALDPAIKAKLAGVWKTFGKTNNDADRATIKDLTGKGNDLQILNAAYKLNSGYGDYKQDFTTYVRNNGIIVTSSKFTVKDVIPNYDNNYLIWRAVDIPSYKIKVSGLKDGINLIYKYGIDITITKKFNINKNGTYVLPESARNGSAGFIVNNGKDPNLIGLTIEQIPDYEGAVVTDGVDDVLISKNTVNKMLEGSKDITVVSIVTPISGTDSNNSVYLNYATMNIGSFRNVTTVLGKTSIVGYKGNIESTTATLINNILGDKNDYVVGIGGTKNENKFVLNGGYDAGVITSASSIAYYGGFIAKGILTTDEINQIIAAYNLDWWIEPDGWYDIKKQGITNENHNDFDDKLIDFSPNKRDLKCFNFGWSENSGVGKWITDFQNSIWIKKPNVFINGQIATYNNLDNINDFVLYISPINKIDIPSFTINVDFNKDLRYYFYNDKGIRESIQLTNGINVLPYSYGTINTSDLTTGFYISTETTYAKIEQIPEIEGGLWYDGVDDYCVSTDKFPAYKDFTVVADRYLEGEKATNGAIICKNGILGAFMFDYNSYYYSSFGTNVNHNLPRKTRKTSYLSKYSSLEVPTINSGNIVDTDYDIITGTFRQGDTRFSAFGLFGFLVYQYSMNEFLIERQLKKRKFGTLYPEKQLKN